MSLLLVGLEPGVGEPLITQLLSQDDEVRVVEADGGRGAHWRELGAFVARGDAGDSDLIERAAQNVRTIVVFERAGRDLDVTVSAVLEGAALAGVGRVVVCAQVVPGSVLGSLRASGIEYVALSTGRRRLLGGGSAPDAAIAEAVDAADDIAGPVTLELDLTTDHAREALRLS